MYQDKGLNHFNTSPLKNTHALTHMATSSASSIINFVKKYPITLCGFSLLFMPSVHRLLLYFTPLLLSTAIFIVAMLSWGPSAESSDEKGKRRGKRNEWAFNGTLKIYGDEDEEEEEEEAVVAEASQARMEDSSIEGKTRRKLKAEMQEPDPDFDEENKRVGKASIGAIFRGHQAEPDPDLQGDCVGMASSAAEPDPDLHGELLLQAEMQEPDPDFDEESKRVGKASIGAFFRGHQAEPDPDLGGDGVGTVSNGAIFRGHQAEPDPDSQGDCVGMASSAAEPDPDLHGEHLHVEAADDTHNFSAGKHQLHAAPDHHSHDHAKSAPTNHDEEAAGEHLDSEHDHDLDYHDAASDDQVNDSDDNGDSEANQGDDYHDAEPGSDLLGSDGAVAHAKSEAAGAARVENDDVRAAIAELRQKLGLVQQRATFSDVDARDHRHPQQIGKGLQALQAAA